MGKRMDSASCNYVRGAVVKGKVMVLSVVLAPKEVIWCDEKSLQVDSFF